MVCTGDRLGAWSASLGEQLSETVGAIGFVVAGGETLPGQWSSAMCAGEALTMPWLVLVCHAASSDDLHNTQININTFTHLLRLLTNRTHTENISIYSGNNLNMPIYEWVSDLEMSWRRSGVEKCQELQWLSKLQ